MKARSAPPSMVLMPPIWMAADWNRFTSARAELVAMACQVAGEMRFWVEAFCAPSLRM